MKWEKDSLRIIENTNYWKFLTEKLIEEEISLILLKFFQKNYKVPYVQNLHIFCFLVLVKFVESIKSEVDMEKCVNGTN